MELHLPWLVVLAMCLGATTSVPMPEVKRMSIPKSDLSSMQELFDKVLKYQEQKDVPLVPFKQFARKRGLFGSGVKLNFHGDFSLAEVRRLLSVYDNNMFATAWITSQLVEVGRYVDAPKPTDPQLLLAIQALGDFHDRNQNFTTSVMNFWSQVYNSTVKYYQSKPDNLVECFKVADEVPIGAIEKILDFLGMKELAKEIAKIVSQKDMFLQAFHIPPDFDDTFVNLGLGSLLYEAKGQLPASWDQWSHQNSNITSVFDALRKYQYRPFSKDLNDNSIDPRTYMWTRPFLDLAHKSKQDVALVPTWVQNIDEVRTAYYKGVIMPFNVNNVDATVASNTIFGITSSILTGLVQPDVLDDPAIAQVYHNTTALIAHELMNNMTSRPDLALTYYPSRVEFYWFVARTFSALDTARVKGQLPRPVMEIVYQMLKASLETGMTKYVLSQAKLGPAGDYYFDDFLGDGDLTPDNKTKARAEDRIFTTAMAANALLYTWTAYNDTLKTSRWRPGTTVQIQETILGAIQWLTAHVYDPNFKPWNAFFSGSVKTFLSLPFWYPANRLEFLNGTAIHNATHLPNDSTAYLNAVKGYIDPGEYQYELTQRHFGMPTPLTFNGYNSEEGYFPLWSSDAYTYSTALVAMARFNSLRQ